jgi:hypothetical protein
VAISCAGITLAASVTGQVAVVNPDSNPGKRRDHAGVVVWLESPDGMPLLPPAGPAPRAVMEQRQKTFLPHIMAVRVGTAVDFPNFDPIFHNVFSNYDGQIFDLNLYAPRTTRRVVFRRPGMVRVFCNIHATMSAVIAVLPTPYFAVTEADGRFEIKAPAGAYRFRVWHERSQDEMLSKLERNLDLPEAGLALGEILVSEQGYLALPHKNKYGREYRPPPEDTIFYPGGRR